MQLAGNPESEDPVTCLYNRYSTDIAWIEDIFLKSFPKICKLSIFKFYTSTSTRIRFRTMGRHLVSSDLVMELKTGLRHLPHEVIHQLFQHAFQSIVEYPPPNFTGTCVIIKEQPIRGTDPMKKN